MNTAKFNDLMGNPLYADRYYTEIVARLAELRTNPVIEKDAAKAALFNLSLPYDYATHPRY